MLPRRTTRLPYGSRMSGAGDRPSAEFAAPATKSTDASRVTIYDVARVAGVSASTVSRAFSRPGRVSSRTAQRIHEVAAELGYRADPLYRADSAARHHLIGLSLIDITNPVFFGIIRGAGDACAKAGYTLVLGDAQESDRREREFFERAVPLVDGLVIASSRVSDTDLRALARAVPVVVLNRHVRGCPRSPPTTRAECAVPSSTSPRWGTRTSRTWRGRRPRGPTACAGVRFGRQRTSSC